MAGLAWTPRVLTPAGGSRGGLPKHLHACLQKALTVPPTLSAPSPGGGGDLPTSPWDSWRPEIGTEAPLSFRVLHQLLLLCQVNQGGSLHVKKKPASKKEQKLCTLTPRSHDGVVPQGVKLNLLATTAADSSSQAGDGHLCPAESQYLGLLSPSRPERQSLVVSTQEGTKVEGHCQLRQQGDTPSGNPGEPGHWAPRPAEEAIRAGQRDLVLS